jgi:hypothetical protein
MSRIYRNQRWNNLTLSLLLLIMGVQFSCADQMILADMEMTGGTTAANTSNCPEEYLRTDGSCWLSDPSAYNEIVENTGSVPTDEELLNVDNRILAEQAEQFLAQEGSGKFYIYINSQREIGIRVINKVGVPVEGVRIQFEILEEEASRPLGSSLGNFFADTDSYGVARVMVQAGDVPTFFKLKMSTEDATSLTYQVNIKQPNINNDPSVETLPPGQRCNILQVEGNYEVINYYELGRFLGDDVFNVLQTINRTLSDPGGLIGNWIRDRIGGVVGDVVRGVVREIVNTLLRGLNLPQWADTTLNIIEDVTTLLTRLEIHGNIRLGKATGDECTVPGVHGWEKLIFSWQGGNCGGFGNNNCGENIINLSELGVSASETEFNGTLETNNAFSATLTIGEHALELNIAVLLIKILQDVILPQRANVNSLGELIANFFPCREFGRLAANLVGNIPFIGGAVAGIAEDACRDGISALGNNFTRDLISNIEVDTFKLQGTCELSRTDLNVPFTQEIEGRWEEGNGGGFLEGTFSGMRRE